jgi:hypothetical protein
MHFILLSNTQTKTVKNISEFNFIFMKKNRYHNFLEIKKMNEIDLQRFKYMKKNSDIYSFYKNQKNDKEKIENENKIEEIKEKEEDKYNKSSIMSNKELLSQIIKINPQVAMMKEIREKEKLEEEKKYKYNLNKSIISSRSDININNENDDDFFSDIKITGINDNIEKNKKKKRQEKFEKMKQKTFDIEELLNNDIKTEDIMKEIEEEQKKWEEKINSSKSSFSINSSIKDDKKKNDYKINVYEFNNLDEKNKKHIIREKKLENKIENAQNILKYRDLVSNETRERLNKEKKEKKELEGSNYISSDGTDKSMSESSYLSYLSKIQGYPY